jgi:hypothetical protein
VEAVSAGTALRGFLGIDPGPHTGLYAAWWDPRPLPDGREGWTLEHCIARECAAADAAAVLRGMLRGHEDGFPVRAAGIEAFVARRKSVKLHGVRANHIVAQVSELTGVLAGYGIPVIARPAGTVKPWATDKRLDEASLLLLAGSSPHVKDAGRHLLFTACQAGLPDPLSAIAHKHDEELNCQACYYSEGSQWSDRGPGNDVRAGPG